jgi:hypothetical protein
MEHWTEADERRIDIIGTNGNDGDHYAELRRPHCYNRPDYPSYQWMQDGWRDGKPRMRYVPRQMSSACMSWAVPQGELSVPERERWDCNGCRHDPRDQSEDALEMVGE